jgi:hypothetical protein
MDEAIYQIYFDLLTLNGHLTKSDYVFVADNVYVFSPYNPEANAQDKYYIKYKIDKDG